MRRLPFCLLLATVLPLFGQAPDFYKQTPRLMWVVRDAKATADAWEKAGVPNEGDMEPYQAVKVELRGKAGGHKFSMLSGYFGNLRADWIQPVKGDSAWKEFLDKRGPGVFGLMFRVPSMGRWSWRRPASSRWVSPAWKRAFSSSTRAGRSRMSCSTPGAREVHLMPLL